MSDEELIDGAYKLVMCIASGGSSQVWEVIEQPSGRHLAMKLLKLDSPELKQNKASLKYEASVLKTLDHPLIIKFDKYSSSRDNTYMTMEHFRTANLKLQLKSDISSVHVRARRLFEGTCQALSHVHSHGWVHRDIKPDNVLMNKAGEIRLLDFSLSSREVKGFFKMIGAGRQKTIQGTRTYIAPETIRKQTPTSQTDLYGLGILFFEVLTGKTPFQATTPEELLKKHLRLEPPMASEFNTNVSPEMDRLIAKLLKKKPADRPASVDEVLGELKRIKIFKEEVTDESVARKLAEANDALRELTEARLDSRADAKLRVMLEADPELARQFEEDKRAKVAKKEATEQQRKARILKSSSSKAASPGFRAATDASPLASGISAASSCSVSSDAHVCAARNDARISEYVGISRHAISAAGSIWHAGHDAERPRTKSDSAANRPTQSGSEHTAGRSASQARRETRASRFGTGSSKASLRSGETSTAARPLPSRNLIS